MQPRGQLTEVRIALLHWQNHGADLCSFDRLFQSLEKQGDFRLILTTQDWLEGTQSALELLNRYQRLLPLPLEPKPMEHCRQVVAAHRQLFAGDAASARVGRNHGLDIWRWVLRLQPEATAPLQLAALFCDVEASLPQAQCARGHLALHARARLGSARAACQALEPIGLPRRDVLRMAELILNLDCSRPEHELATLCNARDLSFFSLSSWDFLKVHGLQATRDAVFCLLHRMSEPAVCLSLMTRQHPDVAQMIEDFFDSEAPASAVRAS